MNTDKAEKLLEKYLDGNCTIKEKQLVENWYNETLRLQKRDPDPAKEIKADSIIRNQLKEYLESHTSRRITLWPNIAAAVAVLFIITFVYYEYNAKTPKYKNTETVMMVDDVSPEKGAILTLAGGETIQLRHDRKGIVIDTSALTYSDGTQVVPSQADDNIQSPILELNTSKGGNYQIDLPDGSKVWLNAASSLKFPKEFKGAERQVELNGEAYFEIAHDQSKPFRVVTRSASGAGQVVEVLGTRFNINAYEEDKAIETTLVEGSVKVSVTASTASKILTPKQQSIIQPGNTNIIIHEVDIQNIIAWKNGDFIFDGEDIESIMRKISRWYDVKVVYKYKHQDMSFKGEISRSKNLSAVLHALAATGQVKFIIKNNVITVMPGKEQ